MKFILVHAVMKSQIIYSIDDYLLKQDVVSSSVLRLQLTDVQSPNTAVLPSTAGLHYMPVRVSLLYTPVLMSMTDCF